MPSEQTRTSQLPKGYAMNVIDRARERIERDGWWSQSTGRSDGASQDALCVGNALDVEAAFDRGVQRPAVDAVCAELGHEPAAWNRSIRRIWRFNDDPSTSLEDVLLVMKRASARLDGAS